MPTNIITLTYGNQPLRVLDFDRHWFVVADVAAVIGAPDLITLVPHVDLAERGATMRRRPGLPIGTTLVSLTGLRQLLQLIHGTQVVERRATDMRVWVNTSARRLLTEATDGTAQPA
jgi:hypothetical protein